MESKANETWYTLTETPETSQKSISARNFSEKCFFCDKLEICDTLHSCQTLYLDNRICKIVHKLTDTKLLAKSSGGDMVATEAKYHRNCLVHFYNRYHNHNIRKSEETYDTNKLRIFREVFVSNCALNTTTTE